ncbi:hypothetical protein ACFL2T_06345, partial [Elusimicrobiota bacterium]
GGDGGWGGEVGLLVDAFQISCSRHLAVPREALVDACLAQLTRYAEDVGFRHLLISSFVSNFHDIKEHVVRKFPQRQMDVRLVGGFDHLHDLSLWDAKSDRNQYLESLSPMWNFPLRTDFNSVRQKLMLRHVYPPDCSQVAKEAAVVEDTKGLGAALETHAEEIEEILSAGSGLARGGSLLGVSSGAFLPYQQWDDEQGRWRGERVTAWRHVLLIRYEPCRDDRGILRAELFNAAGATVLQKDLGTFSERVLALDTVAECLSGLEGGNGAVDLRAIMRECGLDPAATRDLEAGGYILRHRSGGDSLIVPTAFKGFVGFPFAAASVRFVCDEDGNLLELRIPSRFDYLTYEWPEHELLLGFHSHPGQPGRGVLSDGDIMALDDTDEEVHELVLGAGGAALYACWSTEPHFGHSVVDDVSSLLPERIKKLRA